MNEVFWPLAIKFIKFGFVGCSGLAVDMATTFGLKEKLQVNKYLANSTGFLLAATSNYVLNRIWTFANDNPDVSAQYLKFIGVSLVGLLLNNLFLQQFHDRMKMNFYVAKLAAIGLVLFWNFTTHLLFTFNG